MSRYDREKPVVTRASTPAILSLLIVAATDDGEGAAQAKLDAGVYTLHDLRTICRKSDKHWCPYFLARHMMAFANVIVYNYQYMLDPKASTQTVRL